MNGYGPRFQVGDFVVSRAQREALRLWPDVVRGRPPIFQVVEVLTSTTGPGAMTYYYCRGATADRVDETCGRFAEIELERAPAGPEGE